MAYRGRGYRAPLQEFGLPGGWSEKFEQFKAEQAAKLEALKAEHEEMLTTIKGELDRAFGKESSRRDAWTAAWNAKLEAETGWRADEVQVYEIEVGMLKEALAEARALPSRRRRFASSWAEIDGGEHAPYPDTTGARAAGRGRGELDRELLVFTDGRHVATIRATHELREWARIFTGSGRNAPKLGDNRAFVSGSSYAGMMHAAQQNGFEIEYHTA